MRSARNKQADQSNRSTLSNPYISQPEKYRHPRIVVTIWKSEPVWTFVSDSQFRGCNLSLPGGENFRLGNIHNVRVWSGRDKTCRYIKPSFIKNILTLDELCIGYCSRGHCGGVVIVLQTPLLACSYTPLALDKSYPNSPFEDETRDAHFIAFTLWKLLFF